MHTANEAVSPDRTLPPHLQSEPQVSARRPRIATRVRLGFATALLLAGSLVIGPQEASAQDAITIVSIGDSYASGEGAPDRSGPFAQPPLWRGDDRDGAAAGCHRTASAGVAQAAAMLGADREVSFSSFACSGASVGEPQDGGGIRSLLGSAGQLGKIAKFLPGQRIDALVISIGGNDIGFARIVENCAIPGWRCDMDSDLASTLGSDLDDLPRRLANLVSAVDGTALDARNVFLVEYPDPTTGPLGVRCGAHGGIFQEIPLVPNFQGFEGIEEAEARWASEAVVLPLNSALAGAASTASSTKTTWHYVSGVASRFFTHGYCTGGGSPVPWVLLYPRFINTPMDSVTAQGGMSAVPLTSLGGVFVGATSGTMHPNDLGQRALRDALVDAMSFLVVPEATVVSTTVPASMVIGRMYAASVEIQNSGSVTWKPEAGFRLGSQGPQDNSQWGLNRVELPRSVRPGETVSIQFSVTAPAVAGSHSFQWRMVEEGVQWFGATSPLVTVQVVSGRPQMALRVVQNSIRLTSANATVYATDQKSGTIVSGTVSLHGSVVGQTGQAFTYTRRRVKDCDPERKPPCQYVSADDYAVVTAPDYDPATAILQ